ncbi:MAG: ATP-binding cassette domain-containing protein [Candidatus Thioglobus sp.]
MNELFKRFSSHPKITAQLVISTFVIALLGLATSLFVIQVLNRYISSGIDSTLSTLAIGTLIAIGFELLFRSLRRRLILSQNTDDNNKLSKAAFSSLLQTQQSALDQVSFGQRHEVLRGVDAIRAITMPQNVAAVLDLPFALLFVFVLWLLSPALALVAIIAMLTSLLMAIIVQKSGKSGVKKVQEVAAERAGVLGSAVSAAETIRAFNGFEFLSNAWINSDSLMDKLRGKLQLSRDNLQSKIGMVTSLQTVGIITVGAIQTVNGDLSVGAMIGANILAGRALMPITRLSQMGESFATATQAGDLLRGFMQLPAERVQGSGLKNYSGRIDLQNLSFIYPNSTVQLFESINLTLESGKTLAVIGPNGSGKSTLVRLLVGLLEPSKGQILIDNLDLRQMALPWWRMQCSYIPQEPIFLTGTIQDNISLASPDITLERLNEVIRIAGLRSFLDSSQDGLSMMIREGGKNLALGIRRRLALARALAIEGSLLIADEPTEGLDIEGRKAVYAAFQELHKKGVSMVIVSHDQDFLKFADVMLDLGVKPIPRVQKKQLTNVTTKKTDSSERKH